MRQFIIIITLFGMSAISASAQNFLEHLQKKEAGKGIVTVKQSKEIDELVNGNAKTTPQPTTKPADKKDSSPSGKSMTKLADSKAKEGEKAENSTPKVAQHEKKADEKDADDTENIDMSKKIMRQSYRVTGYRVQLFAGGNSRSDRQKAESIGASIKRKYPNEPVYVHFYSPRWTCRMGNYRTYDEAATILGEVKKSGFQQATIVKGKINVQY